MRCMRKLLMAGAALVALAMTTALTPPSAIAQDAAKPNILFVMTDDVGWMNPGIYHQGMMVGETPNIDRIGHEGVRFIDATMPSRAARPGATPSSPA